MRSFLIYPLLAALLLCQLTNGLEDSESTRTIAVETEPAQQLEELLLIDNSEGQQANDGPRLRRQFGGFGGPGFGFGPQAAYFGGGGGFPPGYGGGFGGGGFGGGFGGGRGFQRVRTVTRTRVVNRFGGFGGGYGGGFYG